MYTTNTNTRIRIAGKKYKNLPVSQNNKDGLTQFGFAYLTAMQLPKEAVLHLKLDPGLRHVQTAL